MVRTAWFLAILGVASAFASEGEGPLDYLCKSDNGTQLKVVVNHEKRTAEVYEKFSPGTDLFLIYADAAVRTGKDSLQIMGKDGNKPAGTCNVAMKPSYDITISDVLTNRDKLEGTFVRSSNVYSDPRAFCPELAMPGNPKTTERILCSLP